MLSLAFAPAGFQLPLVQQQHAPRVAITVMAAVGPAPPSGFTWAEDTTVIEDLPATSVSAEAPPTAVPRDAPTSASPPTSMRKLVEIAPAKGMMLMKTWQTRAESMNTLKTVPDGKTGQKLKVVSAVAGEEAGRRKLCKLQFQLFQARSLSLANADAGDYPQAKRQLIPELKLAGAPRGLNAKLFAAVGEGASTLSIVEVLEREWNVLSLCVAPDTRELPAILDAELATLDELRSLCAQEGATLRILPDVEAAMAASREQLGLTPMGDGPNAWLCADTAPTAVDDDDEDEGEAKAGEAKAGEEVGAAAAVHRALLSRRTVNDFGAELPEGWEDALNRAVEAATYAPNHKRTEPWRFHLLGPRAIRRVCELNAEIVAAKKGEAAGAKKLSRWLAMPGWLVVTCVRPDDAPSMEEPAGSTREDYAACCCAVQNLCLSLHADGLGTKWTTGPVNFDARFAAAAGLSDDEYVVGTIWFGEPAGGMPPPPRKRFTLDDVLQRHD